MRIRFLLNRLATLGLFFALVSCSSNDTVIDNTVKIREIMNTAKSGTWHITSFIDSGKDETNNFTGYNFNFNDNGTLIATKDSNVFSGTWSVTEDSNSSNDDSNDDDDIDFDIAFSAPPNFEELTEDWNIVSVSTSKMDFIHVSGGNGGTDTLTFQKN